MSEKTNVSDVFGRVLIHSASPFPVSDRPERLILPQVCIPFQHALGEFVPLFQPLLIPWLASLRTGFLRARQGLRPRWKGIDLRDYTNVNAIHTKRPLRLPYSY